MQNSEQIKAAPAPAPTGNALSEAEASNLAEDLFDGVEPYTKEADALAAVVMRIVRYFAYEPDATTRESSKNFLALAIYSRTDDFARHMTEFEDRVKHS